MKAVNDGSIVFYPVPDLPGLEIVKGMNVVHSFPRHSHRKYCIGIVEAGCRKFSCRGTANDIIPGDILFIGPHEVHSCQAVADTAHSYRMLCMEPGYLQRFFGTEKNEELREPYFTTRITTNRDYFKKLSYLLSILAEPEPVLKQESALLTACSELIGKHRDIAVLPLRLEPRAVKLVREYLESNPAENVTIGRLAQIAALSPYHLMRVFKEKNGLSLHSFQTQVRLNQAKSKLLQGQPIVVTALETGFADQSHFTKMFKKWVGLTPGEYVQHNLQNSHG